MSYSLDSRNENVQLDYNNLRITSPTVFNDEVTFNDTVVFGGVYVNNYTWPREYRVQGGTYNYVSPGSLGITMPAQTVTINQFTPPPTNGTASYFVVQNTGVLHMVNGNNATIAARVSIPGGITTSGSTYKFRLLYLPAGGGVYSLQDEMVRPGAAGPYADTIRLQATMSYDANDNFAVEIEGTANLSVTLEYTITVWK